MLLLRVCERQQKLCVFFQKISSTRSPGHVECLFDNPDEVFLPRSWDIFRWSYEKTQKNNSFKVFFPSTFLWILRNPLWRPRWRFFARSTKLFIRVTKKIRRYFFKKYIFVQTLPMDTWNAFWATLLKYSRQCNKKWLELQKRSKRTYIRFNKNFLSKGSPGHSDCNFDNPAEFFLPKFDSSSLILRKWWK